MSTLIGGVVLITMSIFGVIQFHFISEKINDQIHTQLKEQTDVLFDFLALQVNENKEKIRLGITLFADMFDTDKKLFFSDTNHTIHLTNQITHHTTTHTMPVLTYDGLPLTDNHSLVDNISRYANVTATIFQRFEDGFFRISTNVQQTAGGRALNTYIPNSSPVVQTIAKGKDFVGRAYVVNQWYLTHYSPIEKNGEIIGMYYVGIPERNLQALEAMFMRQSFLSSGYPFLMNAEGKLIIHPKKESGSLAHTMVFQQIKKQNAQAGYVEYTWPETKNGRTKLLYYTFDNTTQTYIVCSAYNDDIMHVVVGFTTNFIIGIVLVLITVLVAVILISHHLTRVITEMISTFKGIAEGNLTASIHIRSKDEIGQMRLSLRAMITKWTEIIKEITVSISNLTSASQSISHTGQRIAENAGSQSVDVNQLHQEAQLLVGTSEQNIEAALLNKANSAATVSKLELLNHAFSELNQAIDNSTKKLDTILEIAQQTRILSINASIEAAKAGEKGKGFGVVAQEVGKLAEGIKQISDQMLSENTETLTQSKKSAQHIQQLIKQIDENKETIDIARLAAEKQLNNVKAMEQRIEALAAIADENTADAEGLSVSSEEMASLSESLQNTIDYFTWQGK